MKPRKFDLHVNPAPLTPAAFDARVSRCLAELAPVIERLIRRHGVTVVYAALISESADATLAGALRHQMSPVQLDKVAQRLLRTIEDARRVCE